MSEFASVLAREKLRDFIIVEKVPLLSEQMKVYKIPPSPETRRKTKESPTSTWNFQSKYLMGLQAKNPDWLKLGTKLLLLTLVKS